MITKSTIGLSSDRMDPILRMVISEASDEGHFVHFVNSVRNRKDQVACGRHGRLYREPSCELVAIRGEKIGYPLLVD